MVKIKVSYESDYELHALKLRLRAYVDKVKIPKAQKGKWCWYVQKNRNKFNRVCGNQKSRMRKCA